VIDRQAVVRRHCVELTQADPATVLTVGNGDFAYSADITGMQTFTFDGQEAARSAGACAVSTATTASWGWHPVPPFQSARDRAGSSGKPGLAAVPAGQAPAEYRAAGAWPDPGPQRFDLGRIGLLLRPGPGAPPAAGADELQCPRQRLDPWSGVITSTFEYAGCPVRVTTVADPHNARVAFRVESALLSSGRASIAVRFPDPGGRLSRTGGWSSPGRHRTALHRLGRQACLLTRGHGEAGYVMRLDWTSGTVSPGDGPHEFVLSTRAPVLEIAAGFWPQDGTRLARAEFGTLRDLAASWWRAFWNTGAAVDLAESTDPRAAELERRVVLSQYLTAVNCSGTLPPPEAGLAGGSRQGRSHLGAHWWSAAHFAVWGRPWLLERSLGWYESVLGSARSAAAREGHDGARWPSLAGPDGLESPDDAGPRPVWQQPHLPYLLELLHRERGAPQRAALLARRFGVLVEETARFMASFAEERDGAWHLPPPLMPAQEAYKAESAEDPTFELAYWWWGLEIAQRWRDRRGETRSGHWQSVQDRLARPLVQDGRYCAIAAEPYLDRVGHPSLLCALGLVPATPLIDPSAMEATLLDVLRDWDQDSLGGWDYPAMAMTATRLHRPGLAVSALLADRPGNACLATGHFPQPGGLLPACLPANGALLAAVSLMIAGWDGDGTTLPGFPADGSWTVRHEGFAPWP
jgi:hypothetical protein